MLGGSNTIEGYFNCPAFESTQEQPPSRPRVLSVSLIFWNGWNNTRNEFVMHTWFWRSLFQLVIFWPKLARVYGRTKEINCGKSETLVLARGGGGGTPYNGLYREAPNLSFGSVKGPKRANIWILWLYKVEKTLYFRDWFLLNDSAFTAVKRNAKF